MWCTGRIINIETGVGSNPNSLNSTFRSAPMEMGQDECLERHS